MESISNNIREYIVNNFLFGSNGDSFTDTDSFLENGIIDSTGILELIQFVEENYDMKIDDSELVPENLDSVDNLKTFIERKKN